MVVAADDVRDPEVDVVDDARKVVCGRAVLAQERDPVEAVSDALGRLAVARAALALPDGPLVPLDLEPAEVVEDRLLAARKVPSGVGVVDPQQHPVAEGAVRHRAKGVADVKRARGARGEAHSSHSEPKVTVPGVREELLAWYRDNRRNLPWRRTRDPYSILVSEVMLQQTQVERVVPRYQAWLDRWPTAEALAAAPVADAIREWQGLGYNRRALNLHRAAALIAAGGWPDDLTELPGVGRYTADAVACFAFERDVLPVDTNVARVRERTGEQFDGECAQALMDLGATVCLARVPRCGICPLAQGCPSRGRRFEPLRKQGRFEGSFRQRRAAMLRLVAEAPKPMAELDREAVESLVRDGLVTVAEGSAALPH
jgi:A/G-specific adenine glycosylase